MISIKSDLRNYGINIPTSITEIKKEYFETLLKDVKVAEHYSVIAICYKEKLFNCLLAISNNTDIKTSVVGLIAKSDLYNPCDRFITDRMSLERSIHFNIPNNVLSFNNVAEYISIDKDMKNSIMTGEFFKQGNESNIEAKNNSPFCYFIDFKLIPNCDIKAAYAEDAKFDNIMKF